MESFDEKKQGGEKTETEQTGFEFGNLEEAEQYLDWKKTVPVEVRKLVEGTILGRQTQTGQTGLPLSDQFLNGLAESLRQKKFVEQAGADPVIKELLRPLDEIGTKGGHLNVFETFANPSASWNLKKIIYETQIKVALEYLADRDLENLAEKTWESREKQTGDGQKENSDELPSQNEEVRSSMESEMEKKEGEPGAKFRVKPFYGGYYKQLIFNKFGPDLHWKKSENIFSEAISEAMDSLGSRILCGKISGRVPLSLPLPYDWTIDLESLQTDAPEGSAEIARNQNGLWYLKIDADGIFNYQIKKGPKQFSGTEEKLFEAEMFGELPAELSGKTEELKKSGFPKMKKMRELVKFIRNHLVYSNSNEAWNKYSADSKNFFQNVWQGKEADCHVANTLAVRALSEIDKSVNFVGGYFVKVKNKEGEAVMHAGNGHAWLEIWDDMSGRSVRLDATPKGDPNMDEEQQEKDLKETGEGDFGEQEDELASEENVKKKIQEMREREKRKKRDEQKQKSINPEQSRFIKLAECTPEQAREFLEALERVRKIKNEKGNSISEMLKDEWKKIIIERKIEAIDYRGPVRMDEGDILEDPVSALIDVKAGEFNPTGFEKRETIEKVETDFGGIDVYLSVDGSGSMNEPDGASGRKKIDVQRDLALLFVDSLMQCAYVSRQQGSDSDLLPIKIMVTLALDKGKIALPLTDKWGPKEQWAFYVALNQSARGGTPTHKTLQDIKKVITGEQEDLQRKKVSKEKWPIHYVAEISDGAPDDFSETEALHEELKAIGVAIRSYCVGGVSASRDSSGPIESFSQLPVILATDVVERFKKLHPKRVR